MKHGLQCFIYVFMLFFMNGILLAQHTKTSIMRDSFHGLHIVISPCELVRFDDKKQNYLITKIKLMIVHYKKEQSLILQKDADLLIATKDCITEIFTSHNQDIPLKPAIF